MATNMDEYIEAEARDRTSLRYEAMFWGFAFAAAAICTAVLLINGGLIATMAGIGMGIFSIYSYVKRDETREEYMLKVGSGRDSVAAKHWANELGMNRAVGAQAPRQQAAAQGEARGESKPQAHSIVTTPAGLPADSPVTPTAQEVVQKTQPHLQQQEQERHAQTAWTDKVNTASEQQAAPSQGK